MSSYSKEYTDKYDPGFPPDFSYEELFDTLQEGYYLEEICEGFGSLGVCKKDGEMHLLFDDGTGRGTLVHIDDVTNETHNQHLKH